MTNYGRLSEGLKLYRDTMGSFDAVQLRRAFPRGDWMEQGVYPCIQGRRADYLRTAIANASGGILQGERPRPEEHLDIHHFRDIVRGNWDRTFAAVFKERTVLDWITEVGRERNTWAHPPAGDLERPDVNRVLDSCARVVAHVDKASSEQLARSRDTVEEFDPGGQASAAAGSSAGGGHAVRGAMVHLIAYHIAREPLAVGIILEPRFGQTFGNRVTELSNIYRLGGFV